MLAAGEGVTDCDLEDVLAGRQPVAEAQAPADDDALRVGLPFGWNRPFVAREDEAAVAVEARLRVQLRRAALLRARVVGDVAVVEERVLAEAANGRRRGRVGGASVAKSSA